MGPNCTTEKAEVLDRKGKGLARSINEKGADCGKGPVERRGCVEMIYKTEMELGV